APVGSFDIQAERSAGVKWGERTARRNEKPRPSCRPWPGLSCVPSAPLRNQALTPNTQRESNRLAEIVAGTIAAPKYWVVWPGSVRPSAPNSDGSSAQALAVCLLLGSERPSTLQAKRGRRADRRGAKQGRCEGFLKHYRRLRYRWTTPFHD